MARKAAAEPAAKAAPKKAAAESAAPKKRASRSTTPTPETLGALKAETLIRLILEEADKNPAFKKRVSAALAGLQGPDAVAALIDRRLAALEKARGFIDWQKHKSFAADLGAMVATIANDLKPLDPAMALDRLARFVAGSSATLDRVEDSSGQVEAVYAEATRSAVDIAADLPAAASGRFATGLVPKLADDDFGLVIQLLADLIPKLPEPALATLDADLAAVVASLPKAAPKARTGGWSAPDPDFARRRAAGRLNRLRKAVADARGDADAFLALEMENAPERPDGTAVAERLLAAGRAEEALEWVRKPVERGRVIVTRAQLDDGMLDLDTPDRRRQAVEIRVLDALGHRDEAQALRWERFERTLDAEALREHLAKLPDFEDEEALERAFAQAAAHKDATAGLAFLIAWPNLDRAARLVIDRRGEWDGRDWQWLAPSADALEADHPLAASLLYRALIDDILARGRFKAYGHGARHLAKLDHLAASLERGALDPDHATYCAGLRKAHGRKSGFWDLAKG